MENLLRFNTYLIIVLLLREESGLLDVGVMVLREFLTFYYSPIGVGSV